MTVFGGQFTVDSGRWSRLALLAALCLLFTVHRPPSAHAQCTPSSDGLVGHWTLDETSAPYVDSSPTSNDAVDGTDSPSSAAGLMGNSLNFSSTTDTFITAPSNATYKGLTSFTVTAWVNPAQFSGFMGIAEITDLLRLGFKFGENKLIFYADAWTSPGDFEDNGAVFPYKADEWQFIALTYDYNEAPGTMPKVYYNGQATSFRIGSSGGTGPFVPPADGTLRIGTIDYAGSNQNMKGLIDDVRIYNRVLSAEEIAALYATRSTANAPAGQMFYDTRSAGMAYCNGTNWVHMGVGPYKPNAVYFDGINDILSEAAMSAKASTDNDKLTASFWIYPVSEGTEVLWQGSGSGRVQFMVNDDGTLGNNLVEIYFHGRNASDNGIISVGSNPITLNAWHHVLISLDAGNNVNHVYIDGALSEVDEIITPANGNIDFDSDYNFSTAGAMLNAGLADFWLDVGTYIDFSIEANRRKFIDANGKPMYLGPDGSIPTGTAPDIFLSGDTANWHTNKGSGGGFTENGALTTASSQPGGCTLPSGPAFSSAGSYNTGNFAARLWGDGTYVYLADRNDGLYIFTHEGANLTPVVHDSTYDLFDVTGDGAYLYTPLGSFTDVKAWRFDGTTLTELATFPTTGAAPSAKKFGDYLYVIDDSGATLRAATFDGVSFTSVASYALPQTFNAATTWSDGNYVYVADGNIGGLLALDFNGSSFTLKGSVVPANTVTDVWGDGTYVYATANNDGLYAYTFDGSSFTQAGHVNPGDFASSVWSDGSYVYLVTTDAHIYAYTFDGSSFSLVDSVDELDYGGDVWGDGAYIYFANGNSGIKAYGGFASCNCGAGPQGMLTHEGVMRYSDNFHAMEYCDGSEWVAMGPVGGTPPANGLVGHWKLDETSGTTAADSSANGNDGTLNGDTAWTTGQNGGAAAFDGSNDDISMGDIGAMDGLTALTVSAWVKSPGVGTPSGEVHFADKSNCTGGTNDGPFELFANDGLPGFVIFKAGGSPNFYATNAGSTDIRDGTWHFIAGRYDGAELTLWIDGVEDTGATTAAAGITMPSTAHQFQLGGTCNGSNYWWTGSIDDVHVYNRALSPTEIQQLYHYGLSGGLGETSANCADPSKPEGTMLYNIDHNVMQYCNGQDWIGIGQ